MRIRLTKIDEFQFLTCFKHQVWGSKAARFKDWNVGDYLVFIVEKTIAGLAEISGEPYASKKVVWDNGLFPHRIPLKFTHAFLQPNRLPILGEVRDALTSTWGPRYGWGILNQQLLQDNPAETDYQYPFNNRGIGTGWGEYHFPGIHTNGTDHIGQTKAAGIDKFIRQ